MIKGSKMSDESRLKMSLAQKGHIPWNKGKTGVQPCSDETRIKMSISRTGKVFTDEHKKNLGCYLKGENSHGWKGGKIYHKGYVLIFKPEHPNATKTGYIYEHRLVMEEFLGRFLLLVEVVHHINEIPDDNKIENLELFANKGKHIAFHNRLKVAV